MLERRLASLGRPRAPSFCAPEARPWILAAAILTSALGFIDGTVVSIAIPAMRASLDATLTEAQWFSNAYMLPLSALILVGGAAGDRFGVARVLMAGLALFLAASLLSALAPTPGILIAARAAKGVGAALMVPGSLALIARAYPRAERGRAIGIWAAASAVTTAAGPILGGAILATGADWAWRALFAINLPLGAVVFWILLARVGRDPTESGTGLDRTGAVLAAVGLGLAAWSLSSLGTPGGPPVWVLAAGAALCLTLFLIWEARARHPMMPLELFGNRSFSAANLATFALYFALSAVLFYQPMTVIAGWGVGEVGAALAFAPLSVFIGVLSGPMGRLADRIGPRIPVAAGALVVATAFAGLALTAPLRSFWALTLPLNSLMALGMSAVVGPLSAAVMAAAPDSRSGAASGINNAVSRMAGLIAVAAMGSLAALVYDGAGGPASFGVTAPGATHAAATDAAFAAIAWVTAGLALLAAAVAWIGIAPRPQSG